MLIQELQAKIMYVDLFQAIEQDHTIVYEIKVFMQKLNSPNSEDSIVGFILEYDPLLKQVAILEAKRNYKQVGYANKCSPSRNTQC